MTMPRLSPRSRLGLAFLGPLLLVLCGLWIRRPVGHGRTALYAEHPPLAHTGGFGEPTCQVCHFGGELNGGTGRLGIGGLPDTVEAGTSVRLIVRLRAEMARAGFMLAFRHPDGRPAGTLTPVDSARVAVHVPDTSDVPYAHHTLAGTELTSAGEATWRVHWTAPSGAADSVRLHVAANAANDDASEFGDDIYATSSGLVVRR